MLAFTFARPVIAARSACLSEIVTPDVGVTFDPDRAQGLASVLREADVLKAPGFRDAARARAHELRPDGIAGRFAALVGELLDR